MRNKLRVFGWTVPMALLALGALGCGGTTVTTDTKECVSGETQDCACPGDAADAPSGQQACVSGEGGEPEWGQCQCEAEPVCTAAATEACTCDDGSDGERTCAADGMSWGDCVCDTSVCTAGATEPCLCGDVAGTRTCAADGMSWGDCQCAASCPDGVEACPGVASEGTTGECTCPDGRVLPAGKACELIDGALCWSACDCSCTPGDKIDCDTEGEVQVCAADGSGYGECMPDVPCLGTECGEGTYADPARDCGCFGVFEENVDCTDEVPNATEALGIRVYQNGEWRWVNCLPVACEANHQILGPDCIECPASCPEGQELVGCGCQDVVCMPGDLACGCIDPCFDKDCGPEFCLTARCENDNPDDWADACAEPVPEEEKCETCHNSRHAGGQPGIEMPHVPFLKCTFCHLGDPDTMNPVDAHEPMPSALQAGMAFFDVTNPQGTYFNYLTHAGLERDEFDNPATEDHEGLRWLQFVNPADIRVVDKACGSGGMCHEDINADTKLSLMRTAAGVLGGARFGVGLPRQVNDLGSDAQSVRLSTVVAHTGAVVDDSFNPNDLPGTVETLAPYPVQDRQLGNPDEVKLLEEAIDKACGDCHIGTKGANRRYGDFRSGGCAACHVLYSDDGRSRSEDPLIDKEEPTYNQGSPGTEDAYVDIMLNPFERPHPYSHRLTRKMPATQCGHCHRESNWTVLQFKGFRIDPNRDLANTYGCQEAGNGDICRYDAQLYDPDANKMRHGLTYHQVIEYEDLNGDGVDDTPADVHWLAGLECIDCHTPKEMHGDGSMKSRMDQAMEIRCKSCHGTVDAYVDPDLSPIRNIEKQGQSFYLKSKISGNLHYIYQLKDSVFPPMGGAIDPRRGNPVYTAAADYAHGRWNGDNNITDGTGIKFLDPSAGAGGGQTRMDFGHADTLECYACHSTWTNNCYGCHLTLADYDTDTDRSLYWWSSISGKMTPGAIVQKDVTFMSTLEWQIGIDSYGKVSPFTPAGKMFFRYLTKDVGADFFQASSGASYKTYRDRLGWGNRVWDANADHNAGLGPQEMVDMNRDHMADRNAALAFNQVVPHTTQHKPRNCTSCHIPVGHEYEPDDDPYARQAAVTWGVYPRGADAEISAYLDAVDETVQRYSGATFLTSAGFLIPDPDNRDVPLQAGDVSGDRVDTFTAGQANKFAGATAGDRWAHRLDWVAMEDGFPLASNSHTRIDGMSGLLRLHDQTGAGPLSGQIITKLRDQVRVYDMPGYNRVDNKLDPVFEGDDE